MKYLVLMVCFLITNAYVVAEKFVVVDKNNIRWYGANYGGPTSKAYLKKLKLESIEAKKLSFRQCVNFSYKRSLELDPNPVKKGINITVELTEKLKLVRINFQAEEVSLYDFLKEMAKQANVNCYLTTKGVLFCQNGVFPEDVKNDKVKIVETIYKAKVGDGIEWLSNGNKFIGVWTAKKIDRSGVVTSFQFEFLVNGSLVIKVKKNGAPERIDKGTFAIGKNELIFIVPSRNPKSTMKQTSLFTYSFKDGKLSLKDGSRKPITIELEKVEQNK